MWGGSLDRNMVSEARDVSIDFIPPHGDEPGRKLLWSAKLGSQTFSPPTVADGKVFIGTNNDGGYRPNHEGDRGCLLCFSESTGEFLWQLTRPKLETGRVNDWPLQGIRSVACVEGDRLWVITNRAELMCLDTNGFYDDENDGLVQDEVDSELKDADIVWSLDMRDELGVFPHNRILSSPLILGELIFLITSNGVDETHRNVASPEAPAFLAIDKTTGKIAWQDNSPFDKIMHGQWSSPTVASVNGNDQIVMAGGDGWIYSFDADMGGLIWKFDLNPKEALWKLGGMGKRNSVIGTPVFVDDSIIVATGQDPEHGEEVGHLYRIDATMQGDVSHQNPDGSLNSNSGMIWSYGGVDLDGDVTGNIGQSIFRRTVATASVANGLVFIPDIGGWAHCIDLETGERQWEHDLLAQVSTGFMVADDKVFICDTDGTLTIVKAGREIEVLDQKKFKDSLYSHVVIANDKIFVADRRQLYVFDAQ